jgi:hypothetical protein
MLSLRKGGIVTLLKMMKNQTPEELNFNFTFSELKEVAKELNIKGRSKMDKITLALNIEYHLGGN